MKSGSVLRGGGIAAISLVALAWAAPAALAGDAAPAALAGEVGMQSAQASAATYTFAIAAKPLAQALDDFGRVTGLSVVYTTGEPAALTAPAVSGRLSADQALRQLLAGSGLTWRFTDAKTVTLEKVSAEGAMVLDPVTVEGVQPEAEETAWGPVKGYVAKRSAAGTKTDTAILETPQSVSVVTRQEMTDRNVQTVTDALRYVPGISTQPHGDDGRYDRLSIRGFDSFQQADYRDGLRQIGNSFVLFRTEPYGLERIDVLRGPSSVLFGQNAPGGVINRISKMPTADPVREVQVQAGSFDRRQGAFDFGGAATEDGTILYRVTGLARDSDTQFEFDDDHAVQDDRRYIAPAVTWRPNGDTSLTLLAQYLDDNAGIGRIYTRNGQPTHVLVGEPDFNRFDQTQVTVGTMLEHHLTDDVTLRQNMRYGRVDTTYRYLDEVSTVGTTMTRFSSVIDEDIDTLGVDNQVEAKLATGPLRHTVLGGLDYLRASWSGQERRALGPSLNVAAPVYGQAVPYPTTLTTDSHQVMDQFGLYGQDQIKLGEEWVVTVGGRHDWAGTTTDNHLTKVTTETDDRAFSGRAGITYLSPTGLAPYLSYSESFLPVTGTKADGSPFKPTTARQHEAGVKVQPTGIDGFFTASVFELTQQNVSTQDPNNSSYRVQTGEVRSRGLELEGKADLAPGLGLIASYTYQDVEVTKSNDGNVGKRPTVVPEQMASVWLDYTVQAGLVQGLGFGAGIRYTGSTAADRLNTQENPSATLFDAAVHYDLGGLRLALNATNLLNKETPVCDNGSCYWGSERTVLGTVTYRW